MQWHTVCLIFAMVSFSNCGVLKVEELKVTAPLDVEVSKKSSEQLLEKSTEEQGSQPSGVDKETLKKENSNTASGKCTDIKHLAAFADFGKITARFGGKHFHSGQTQYQQYQQYPQYPQYPAYPYNPFGSGIGSGLNSGFGLSPTIATLVTPNGNFTIIGAFPTQFPGQFGGQFPGQFGGQFPGQFPGQVFGQFPGGFPINGFPGNIG